MQQMVIPPIFRLLSRILCLQFMMLVFDTWTRFYPGILLRLSSCNGNTRCTGHSECDAIIMDKGVVSAIPELTANDIDAALIHEAAIGKIAGEQLTKLMTLGLTEKEAEQKIIEGFLK